MAGPSESEDAERVIQRGSPLEPAAPAFPGPGRPTPGMQVCSPRVVRVAWLLATDIEHVASMIAREAALAACGDS